MTFLHAGADFEGSGPSAEPLDDPEPLEDDQRVVIELELGVAEAGSELVDVAVPEPLVGDAELVGIGVAFALVDRVPIVDIGEPHDPAVDGLDQGDRTLLRVQQDLACPRDRQGFAAGFDLDVQAGGGRLRPVEGESRELVAKRPREREAPRRQAFQFR